MRALLILLALCLPFAAATETVVLGLSKDTIRITTDFDGSEILIFGAVKRTEPLPDGPPLQVAITVAGPSTPLTVRRKDRVAGIWINTDAVEVDAAPSYYAVATSADWSDTVSETTDLRYKISVPRAIRSVGAPQTVSDSQSFTDAVIRIREGEGLYRNLIGGVIVDEETLFRTVVDLPANLTEGTYKARIFLTRQGDVIDKYETEIHVGKVGLEKFLFALSRENSLIYGLLSLALAAVAGWGASTIFRLLRQG